MINKSLWIFLLDIFSKIGKIMESVIVIDSSMGFVEEITMLDVMLTTGVLLMIGIIIEKMFGSHISWEIDDDDDALSEGEALFRGNAWYYDDDFNDDFDDF